MILTQDTFRPENDNTPDLLPQIQSEFPELNTMSFSDVAAIVNAVDPGLADILHDINNTDAYEHMPKMSKLLYKTCILAALTFDTDCGFPSLNEMKNLLFRTEDPTVAAREKIDDFANKHNTMYAQWATDIVDGINNGEYSTVILESGMHGGKTTLMMHIGDKLEASGYKVQYYMASALTDFFNPDPENKLYVHSRALERYIEAKPFNAEVLENIKAELLAMKKSNSKVCAQFDEFSFADLNVVKDFKAFCAEEGIVLVMAGLHNNYADFPLPYNSSAEGDNEGEREAFIKDTKVVQCKSFIAGVCEEIPYGDSTSRFAVFPTSKKDIFALDFVFPLIVFREWPIARYVPELKERTIRSILKYFPYFQNELCNPSPEFAEEQAQFLRYSKQAMMEG